MGIADAFSKEDRIPVKASEYYSMVKTAARAELLENAVRADVPRDVIVAMITGKSRELAAYEDTGLTPEKIREMDKLYTEKCEQVNSLEKTVGTLEGQMREYMELSDGLGNQAEELERQLNAAREENGKLEAELKTAWKEIESLKSREQAEDKAKPKEPVGEAKEAKEAEDGEAKRKKPAARRRLDRDEVVRLKQEGLTLKEIAEKMECSINTVMRAVNAAREEGVDV